MATTTTTTLSNTYQEFFSKQLLQHQVQATILNQFAYKRPLDKNAGAKIISFFRRTAAALNSSGQVANVSTLTEGTPIAAFNGSTMTKVSATLAQYGEACKITDIVLMTQLFNALRDNIGLMGEESALHADAITRDVLQAGFTTIRYGGAAASFAALGALSTSAGKITMVDVLDSATQLKINRAMGWSGYFMAVVCPQVSRDLQNDGDWLLTHQYAQDEAVFKGEIGKWAGVRFVEHTNPFKEQSGGTEGTYSTAGTPIFTTPIFGQQAYGVPALAGEKVPMNKGEKCVMPEVIICDKPDKSDPLNQFMTAGWKGFWTALVLNASYGLLVKSKTEFV